jgi:hypothetical protein
LYSIFSGRYSPFLVGNIPFLQGELGRVNELKSPFQVFQALSLLPLYSLAHFCDFEQISSGAGNRKVD